MSTLHHVVAQRQTGDKSFYVNGQMQPKIHVAIYSVFIGLNEVTSRGGYSVRKMMGVCRWPLKIGPQKIEGKMKFGA